MGKHAVTKLPYLMKYIPDQYKTQQMCNKTILEKSGTDFLFCFWLLPKSRNV